MCHDASGIHAIQTYRVDSWLDFALTVATRCAKRYGLDADVADDCAMEFVARMLTKTGWGNAHEQKCVPSAAWIYRCAVNHTIDFTRANHRRRQHEGFSLDTLEDDSLAVDSCSPSCHARFLQSWCHEQIISAINHLGTRQRRAFVAHYLYEVPIRDVAAALDLAPHAVEQLLFRARRRLRDLLTRQGFSQVDLEECANYP